MSGWPGLPSIIDRPDAVIPSPAGGAAEARPYATLVLSLDAGVPARLAIDGTRTLVLGVPSGQARRWLDDDPSAVVIDISAGAVAAVPPGAPRSLDAPAARLTLVESGAIADSAPLVAGSAAVLSAAGRASLEVVVDSFTLTVGTLRGAGQYGSSIALRWRDLRPAPNEGPAAAIADESIPRFGLWRRWRRAI